MAEVITINDVRASVIRALDAVFPDVPISGEEIKQLLDPPRMFVRLLEPDHVQELGRRHRRAHPFVVRYFAPNGPHNTSVNEELYGVAEQLTAALKWIEVAGGQVAGDGMRFEIDDDVLHFFVTYSVLVWSEAPAAPLMGKVVQEGGLKP